ncbi:TIGR02757 family protein [Sphingobacterium lactis]|uniref:TIGR02757 family protein n=1 Tax=Sphingobacterium lactis TaxID=797291 RepID=A0A1H5Y1B4_9SPHI|nr:TIGR02757 family protein [Sphingobacterium lactis]SEG17794.1 TIGR02757 family protein [Sphingobacterium lactis]
MDLSLKDFLDKKVEEFNRPDFIPHDPISIPHQFSKKQDVEIMGFIASILAWGQRKTIINKCNELIARMDGAPYDFIRNHQEEDLRSLLGFKHRTFNDTDLLYFISFFQYHYRAHDSLEQAFLQVPNPQSFTIEEALNGFKDHFFSLPDYPYRTRKHVSSPLQKSTCKRLNMFLRWMVRKDTKGVDFGIWHTIQPSQLICPCDVHVERVARKFGLIQSEKVNWKTALELTENLRLFDPQDPIKYDFALFGLGVGGEL